MTECARWIGCWSGTLPSLDFLVESVVNADLGVNGR